MPGFLYSAAVSLDGFIAGADGDMSWLAAYEGPNPAVDELISDTGALLVGRGSYDGDDPNRGRENEGEAFGGGWDGPQFVLTHRPDPTPPPGVTFVTDFDEAVAVSRAAAGDGLVNVIGANVAAQCLAAGVLDEIVVMIVPVLLGDGTRLFAQPGGTNLPLQRIGLSHNDTVTNVRFRVTRP